jgi:hypothetical protein
MNTNGILREELAQFVRFWQPQRSRKECKSQLRQ